MVRLERKIIMHSKKKKTIEPLYKNFPTADEHILAQRRLVRHGQQTKFDQSKLSNIYKCHMAALNTKFSECIAKDEDISLASVEYLWYAQRIEHELNAKNTVVVSFGSGDCGQLGHGTQSDKDTVVAIPRAIESLRNKQIAIVACGGLHNVACTNDGYVYTWGCNDEASLGRPGDEARPMRVDMPSECGFVSHVAAGDTQSLAVTSRGDVYAWGCYKDKEGKAWFDTNDTLPPKRKQESPLLIEALRNIVRVDCGSAYNAALKSDGSLLTWGIGEIGELGRSKKLRPLRNSENGKYDTDAIERDHLTPRKVLSLCKAFACGAYHLLAANNAGTLFTSGLNNYGQLGDGTRRDRARLRPILRKAHVLQLAGGQHHSLCLLTSKQLLAFGRADYGQLGLGKDTGTEPGSFVMIPTPIPHLRFDLLCSGSNHCIGLSLSSSSAPSIYAWGYGDMNALGLGSSSSESQDKFEPTLVNLDACALFSQDNEDDSAEKQLNISILAAGGQHSVLVVSPPPE
uniref:RCC1-like domain-containing protein n=1 Tax=Aureoumbra lagunensis TaxID=44058 RepID=A0A7S3NMW9_9STRA